MASRLERFRARFASISVDTATNAIEALEAAARRGERENSDAPIQACAQALGLGADFPAVRACMCMPARETTKLLPGAAALLGDAKGLGLARLVVTNAFWRDGASYCIDFADFEIDSLVDEVVTSIDAGSRKPDLKIFEDALRLADCPPEAAVYIGNDEVRDITPARGMGMRTVRVAIEEPPPESSQADFVVTSLDEVRRYLWRWVVA